MWMNESLVSPDGAWAEICRKNADLMLSDWNSDTLHMMWYWCMPFPRCSLHACVVSGDKGSGVRAILKRFREGEHRDGNTNYCKFKVPKLKSELPRNLFRGNKHFHHLWMEYQEKNNEILNAVLWRESDREFDLYFGIQVHKNFHFSPFLSLYARARIFIYVGCYYVKTQAHRRHSTVAKESTIFILLAGAGAGAEAQSTVKLYSLRRCQCITSHHMISILASHAKHTETPARRTLNYQKKS